MKTAKKKKRHHSLAAKRRIGLGVRRAAEERKYQEKFAADFETTNKPGIVTVKIARIKGPHGKFKPQAVAKSPKEQYLDFHKECCDRMVAITRAKNADYTGASVDPFANFARVEALGIATTEQGFLTRMTDKLCRIASFAAKGQLMVKDESVEDTLLDLANYCILLAGYLRQKAGRIGGAT